MSDSSWEHIILAALAAVPATIAAFSSLRNGRALKNGHVSRPHSGKLDISNVQMEHGTQTKSPKSFGRN